MMDFLAMMTVAEVLLGVCAVLMLVLLAILLRDSRRCAGRPRTHPGHAAQRAADAGGYGNDPALVRAQRRAAAANARGPVAAPPPTGLPGARPAKPGSVVRVVGILLVRGGDGELR